MSREDLIEEKFRPILEGSDKPDGHVSVVASDLAVLCGLDPESTFAASPEQAQTRELQRLKAENARLELERDAAQRAVEQASPAPAETDPEPEVEPIE